MGFPLFDRRLVKHNWLVDTGSAVHIAQDSCTLK
jgi:hypothetical protein